MTTTTSSTARKPTLPAWKVILKVIIYRKDLWLGNLLMMLFTMLFYQIPGLALREFMNMLSGNAQYGLNLWTIIGLLFAAEIGSIVGIYGLIATNVPFFQNTMTLLRKNLLRHILRRPGASALPDSPGEAISRFRGDVFEIPLFALWINDLLGSIAFNVIALFIMIRISPTYTALAMIPFLIVAVIAAASTKRIDEYRRASSRATGIITGFIGEFFGAVQAVKVSAAEKSVINRFDQLNEDRRKLALRDRLFNEILNSIFHNATSLGTGVILILAGQAMQLGTFTVGDFALFVYYLEFISEMTTFTGLLVARYRQIGISVERMQRLMEGAAPQGPDRVQPRLPGRQVPPGRLSQKDRSKSPAPSGSPRSHLPVSRLAKRHRRHQPQPSAAARSPSSPAASAPARPPCCACCWACFPSERARSAGTARRWMIPAPSSSRPAAPTPPRFRACSATRCATTSSWASDDATMTSAAPSRSGGARTRPARAGARDWRRRSAPKGVKLSGGQIQRTAAARMFVRDPELLVFDDLSSALDVETERVLWERVFDQRGPPAWSSPSPRRPAPRRPHHRAQGGQRRGRGQAR